MVLLGKVQIVGGQIRDLVLGRLAGVVIGGGQVSHGRLPLPLGLGVPLRKEQGTVVAAPQFVDQVLEVAGKIVQGIGRVLELVHHVVDGILVGGLDLVGVQRADVRQIRIGRPEQGRRVELVGQLLLERSDAMGQVGSVVGGQRFPDVVHRVAELGGDQRGRGLADAGEVRLGGAQSPGVDDGLADVLVQILEPGLRIREPLVGDGGDDVGQLGRDGLGLLVADDGELLLRGAESLGSGNPVRELGRQVAQLADRVVAQGLIQRVLRFVNDVLQRLGLLGLLRLCNGCQSCGIVVGLAGVVQLPFLVRQQFCYGRCFFVTGSGLLSFVEALCNLLNIVVPRLDRVLNGVKIGDKITCVGPFLELVGRHDLLHRGIEHRPEIIYRNAGVTNQRNGAIGFSCVIGLLRLQLSIMVVLFFLQIHHNRLEGIFSAHRILELGHIVGKVQFDQPITADVPCRFYIPRDFIIERL